MLKKLQELGLSENEARVYLASLEIGRATADELSKHAQIKRPTTYVQIESLTKKGLMSTYEEGKKTYFIPESPEYLKRLLDQEKQETTQKEKELSTLLPDLTNLFDHAGERPKVRFFNGKEGIVTLREEILKTAKNKEIRIIFSQDALANVFSKEELDSYSENRARNNIISKAMYTRAAGKFEGTHPSLTERRFIPEDKLSLGSDLIIYENKVALMALKGTLFGVLIENDEITKSMMSLFDLLWSEMEKYQ